MIQAKLAFASLSDKGQVRATNEDAVAVAPKLAILADGMGGYNAGEVASGMACALLKNELESALAQHPPSHDMLQQAIGRTNSAIYQLAQSQNQYTGMGTTLVLVLFHGAQMMVAHLGDSRLYRLRERQLCQLTSDHSVLQAQIDAGMLTKEQAKLSQNKNLVTKALGIEPQIEAEIHTWPTEKGDLYLLCSDGLSDMLDDEQIQTILQDHKEPLDLCVNQLITNANLHGGRDNVSAILIKVLDYNTSKVNPVSRFLNWLK